MVGQVVLHAAGLHHAAGGDDYAGLVAHIELLALHDGVYVVQTVEPEGVGVCLAVLGDGVVEALRVQPHDVRGRDGEGAVDEHVDVRQQLAVLQTVEGIDDFLGAPDGEAGYDELALLLGAGVEHGHQQLLLGALHDLV